MATYNFGSGSLTRAKRVPADSSMLQSPLTGHRASIAAVKVQQHLARRVGGNASGCSPGRGSDLLLSSTLARRSRSTPLAQRGATRSAKLARQRSRDPSATGPINRPSTVAIMSATGGLAGAPSVSDELQAQVRFALSRTSHGKRVLNPPPRCGAWRKRGVAAHNASRFEMYYKAGVIPCNVEHGANCNRLTWTTPLSELNMAKFLPMFFDGVRAKGHPYNFIATTGVTDMLNFIREHGEAGRVLGCLGELVHHMRVTLNMRETKLILYVLTCLRSLLDSGPEVGPALTPFYRRLLPVLNLYWRKRRNLGDRTDYAQAKNSDLGVMVQRTVEMMERTGSPDASMWIKYHIPTYESVL